MGCAQSKSGSADITRVPGQGGPPRASFRTPLGRSISREEYHNRHPKCHATNVKPLHAPKPAPSLKNAKTEEERLMLHIISVDMNLAENVCNHKTYMYKQVHPRDGTSDLPLVVRRGQAFDFTISTNRMYDIKSDVIRLVLECSDEPDESRGTRINLALSEENRFHLWAAKILNITEHTVNRLENGTINDALNNNPKDKKKKKKKEVVEETEEDCTYYEMKIRLFTPPTCIVAKWRLNVETVIQKQAPSEDCCVRSPTDKLFRYPQSFTIYIIFNPWCADDQVYIDDETCRNEYVLNDAGYVYKGTVKNILAKPWQYGQFEEIMLDCCFYLLDKSLLSYKLRGNPVHICRQISALTNSIDDGGVMVGDWSGMYHLGTCPMAWISSVSILDEYWRTKQPVRYGQCWVFAAVVTTLCRSLGIPCRPVTNYQSAHDTDGSITIDSHWNHKGEPLEKHNRDTIWNFHVWNDVWMRRPDLPSGFGGWQAIDATPQETSNGIFCTGPMSVEALKNGLIHLPYDGHFVFAEVNADRVHWIHPEEGGYVRKIKETCIVGKHISTKAPMSDDRLDVTDMYKFPEGCHLERTAVLRAARETQRCDIYETPVQDMTLELVEKERGYLGQPFDVTFNITNHSAEQRTVKLTLTAQVVHYTGVPGNLILSESYTVEVPGTEDGTVVMHVKPEKYLKHLVDMCMIQINSMALVLETNQVYCQHDILTLDKPKLQLTIDDSVIVGEEFSLELQLTNPFNKPLTRCEYHIHGTGIQEPMRIKQPVIARRAEATLCMTLFASQIGTRKLMVSFDCRELSDVSTETLLNVLPKPEHPKQEEQEEGEK